MLPENVNKNVLSAEQLGLRIDILNRHVVITLLLTITDVVSLDVEVRESDGDAVLRRRHDQPDTVLVGRVDARVERARQRAVSAVDVATARVSTTHTRNTHGEHFSDRCSNTVVGRHSVSSDKEPLLARTISGSGHVTV